jgi:putative N6-adenine-specific DNA methylase
MIAAHQAPGLHRKFGFERWPDFEIELWSSIRQEALDARRKPPHTIIGSDIEELTVNLAKVSLDRTGLLHHVEFHTQPFDLLQAPRIHDEEAGGLLVTNPPYEIRLTTGNIEAFYQMIGDTLKQQWKGYSAWIITGSPAGLKSVGLKTSRRIALMNGPLEVRFVRYDLYDGSRKQKHQEEE